MDVFSVFFLWLRKVSGLIFGNGVFNIVFQFPQDRLSWVTLINFLLKKFPHGRKCT